MPDTQATDKNSSSSSSAALPSSFNKTLSALTGGKPVGGSGAALGAKLCVPAGSNGAAAAAPPQQTLAPPPATGGMAGLFGAGGGGGGGGGGLGGLLGVTSALQQQQQQQPNAVANDVSSNNVGGSLAVPQPPVANSSTPPPSQNASHHHRVSASGAPAATADDVITVTETLIDAIGRGDYDTWKKMTSHDLTCFEPESQGCLVEGREFHKYYFDLGIGEKAKNLRVNLIAPRVHLLGPDAGVIGYVLLTQSLDAKTGLPESRQCEESRVWRRDRDGLWRCVHFHRSVYAPGRNSAPFPPNNFL